MGDMLMVTLLAGLASTEAPEQCFVDDSDTAEATARRRGSLSDPRPVAAKSGEQ